MLATPVARELKPREFKERVAAELRNRNEHEKAQHVVDIPDTATDLVAQLKKLAGQEVWEASKRQEVRPRELVLEASKRQEVRPRELKPGELKPREFKESVAAELRNRNEHEKAHRVVDIPDTASDLVAQLKKLAGQEVWEAAKASKGGERPVEGEAAKATNERPIRAVEGEARKATNERLIRAVAAPSRVHRRYRVRCVRWREDPPTEATSAMLQRALKQWLEALLGECLQVCQRSGEVASFAGDASESDAAVARIAKTTASIRRHHVVRYLRVSAATLRENSCGSMALPGAPRWPADVLSACRFSRLATADIETAPVEEPSKRVNIMTKRPFHSVRRVQKAAVVSKRPLLKVSEKFQHAQAQMFLERDRCAQEASVRSDVDSVRSGY